MFPPWNPHEIYNSIYEIPFAEFEGYGIIFDVDGTLMDHHGKKLSREVEESLYKLSENHNICVLSNCSEARERELIEIFPYYVAVVRAYPFPKPFPSAYDAALKQLGTGKKTVVVGDQWYTDILGGNLMDLYTILVRGPPE